MSTYARYFNTYAEYEASDAYNASYPIVVYRGTEKIIATNETNAPLITLAHTKSWIPSSRDYMTAADAAAVTQINLTGNTTLIKFNEFRYFTGVGTANYFNGCTNLEEIELPKHITTLRPAVFADCQNLKIINIPDGVTTIDDQAFKNCSQLQQLTIPNSVTEIGDEICYNCSSLNSVNINTTNITEIPRKAFSYCTSLVDVNIPHTVTEIGEEAFSYCTSLKNISIPKISNVPSATTTFGDKCFCGCSQLESFNIPDSTTTLGEEMFSGCTNLKNVGFIQKTLYDFGDAKLTTLSDAIFSGCKSLQTFVMPHSVTAIPAYAFSYCTSLKDVTISPSITSINMTAFDNCTSLTDLRIRLTTPPTLTGSLDALHTITKSLQRIHIPKGSKTDYEHEWRTIIGSDIQFIEFSNIFTDL